MYFPVVHEGYNCSSVPRRVSVVHPVLESLKAHHAASFGWALVCCSWQREMAEDVLQESYLRVLDGRAEYSDRSSQKTWFFAVIKRVAADVYRNHKRRSLLNVRLVTGGETGSWVKSPGVSNPLSEGLQREESVMKLQQALLQLSVRQREVMHLVFYSELTLEEAAATLDISLGSTRTHYHRGKERLAQLINMSGDYER